jgi:hypothetical protein
VKYFRIAAFRPLQTIALGLGIAGGLFCQSPDQGKQTPPVKIVADGYHIVHPDPADSRPTAATSTAPADSKKTTKRKNQRRTY